MSVTRLEVTYRSPEVDKEFDKKILELFNTLDFVCIERSYSLRIYSRLLMFERHTKEEVDEGSRSKEAQLKT